MSFDPRFQQYQERQGKAQVIRQLRAARYHAGFVVELWTKQTLFVGLWERLGERTRHRGHPFEAGAPPKSTAIEFNTRRIEAFDEYCGRLVVDWGEGTRAWVQRADKRGKPIIELRRTRQEAAFPGFLVFQAGLDEIDGLYASWIQVLQNARGVYLLVRRETGEQYVGSAYGDNGFFGRWLAYSDGHGGNLGMRELAADASEYDVTILEVAASTATVEDICQREAMWKQKLGTRESGLNRN
ncbi:GIY-YIG nuclease family protein [Haliangium sp.]|uniref:GIY-YIG nuclease family protein n=1 Tax=Haliangium sp. TaxID=2663208 RepID=UPI003D11EFE8